MAINIILLILWIFNLCMYTYLYSQNQSKSNIFWIIISILWIIVETFCILNHLIPLS